MRRRVLLDTGPLVAFLNRRDEFHGWVTGELATIEPPFLTCEAVLSEDFSWLVILHDLYLVVDSICLAVPRKKLLCC
jgi:hypothetical protein